MDAIEKRARELLRSEYMLSLSGAGPKQRHLYECAIRAIIAALTPPEGHVVVTRNEAGQAVAVTRQDGDGRILSVIAEFEAPEGYVVVPVEMTNEMVKAVYPLHYFTYLGQELRENWRRMIAARPEVPNVND